MAIESYRDLLVWQGAMDLVVMIYDGTRCFPGDEKFGLTSQVRRAAVSTPSNIAEGHSRESSKDFLYHLSIAQGSLAELETQLEIAERLGYTPSEKSAPIFDQIKIARKTTLRAQERITSQPALNSPTPDPRPPL